MIYRAIQLIQIFCAHGRTGERANEGNPRGPRGPKNNLRLFIFEGLTFLVQLDLGAGVGASFLQSGAQVLEIPRQKRPVLLGLCSAGSLDGQLFIELVHTGLQLLNLLAVFRSKGMFVFNLGEDGRHLLLLTLNSLGQLSVDTLKVRNGLLSQLEVTLNLTLGFLHVCLGLLLSLKSVLAFVKGLLELALDLAKMVATIFSSLDVFLRLKM